LHLGELCAKLFLKPLARSKAFAFRLALNKKSLPRKKDRLVLLALRQSLYPVSRTGNFASRNYSRFALSAALMRINWLLPLIAALANVK
jgi:hypothetical protein